MSMGKGQELYPQRGETRFFTFASGRGEVDAYYKDLLFAGPVGEWADTRKGKYGEVISAKHMYVTDWGTSEEHRVAWVYHSGLQLFEGLEGYSAHHVVCDCAAEHEDSALPRGLDCNALAFSLADRAEYWSREYALSQLLGALSIKERDTGVTELSINGQELLMSSMLGFLDMERSHPDRWFGNWLSGRMDTETLARLTEQTEEETVAYVEMLSEGGLLEYDGREVRLRPSPEPGSTPAGSINYVSYDEFLGIGKLEKTKRQVSKAHRSLRRKLLGINKTKVGVIAPPKKNWNN